jgi:adenine-specific DNA-methyltransferase
MAKSPAPTEVEHFAHDAAKRKNIPTAENQGLVPDDDKAVKLLRYPRNPDLDPQLVWRGKDAEDGAPLEVAAPPIYIQEKIHPRAIIENLRRQSKARKTETAPQIDFFHDFNGLEADPEARTEFYAHDQNWQNRMILGDSLQVMGSLAEREALRGKVQCIYFDPPYGIKFNSNWQPSTKSRDVKDGKEDSISREPEVVRAFRDTWKDGIHSYLSYLRDRLIVARDLLTESGSIFVQIGDENVHIVRGIMDEVFGSRNFCCQIQFQKTGSQESILLSKTVDYVLWFARNKDNVKYRQLYLDREAGDPSSDRYDSILLDTEIERRLSKEEVLRRVKIPSGRIFRHTSLISDGKSSSEQKFDFRGKIYEPKLTSHWKTTVRGLEKLARANRIAGSERTIRYRRFLDDFPIIPMSDRWESVQIGTELSYVVQTSTKVIERCVLMTTDPGDLVLDPTCGSGTTATVAEQWGRRWITIDTSRVALTLARARLMGTKYDYFHLRDSNEGAAEEGKLTGKPPANGPFGKDIRQGFVYERAPHVTLKSIANNQEIDLIWDRYQAQLEPLHAALNAATSKAFEDYQIPREAAPAWPEAAKTAHAEWWRLRRERQREIDASIARNADVEYLYDRPIKAKGVVRVAGPFTVESLSPHRVLPLGEDPYLAEMLEAGEDASAEPEAPAEPASSTDFAKGAAAAAPSTDFATVVYENLLTSGVQNTRKGETLKFEWLKPRVSRSGLVPFEGRYTENGETRRAAICIGPEYDTVGYDLVKRAAREAADLYDTLIVCGFAFAPEVDETRLNFGELKVLRARMNQDLRMGDKLKATGAGNLFVVFGEPDIVVHQRDGGMVQAEIRGMDIFDPTTGQVRSSGGDDLKNDVAAWFVDDDYNEESFFVKQAYFVGDSPYEALKRALKAEIDETAWEEMNSTLSRPFPKPESGRICVKVINHFGDEVQKVFVV